VFQNYFALFIELPNGFESAKSFQDTTEYKILETNYRFYDYNIKKVIKRHSEPTIRKSDIYVKPGKKDQ
jgi:hypothetical protein